MVMEITITAAMEMENHQSGVIPPIAERDGSFVNRYLKLQNKKEKDSSNCQTNGKVGQRSKLMYNTYLQKTSPFTITFKKNLSAVSSTGVALKREN